MKKEITESATVEEADLSVHEVIWEAYHQYFPNDGTNLSLYQVFKLGFRTCQRRHAQQSKPIKERHWEMEPLEPEHPGLIPITEEQAALFEPEPETMGGKTLQECKDEVARSIGHKDWKEFLDCYPESREFQLMHVTMTEVAESQSKSQPQWRETAKELPEVGQSVEVITEYLNKGEPESARFIGYMNEYGELYSMPDDDHYGWTFAECATYWRYLSDSPSLQSPSQPPHSANQDSEASVPNDQ